MAASSVPACTALNSAEAVKLLEALKEGPTSLKNALGRLKEGSEGEIVDWGAAEALPEEIVEKGKLTV